MAIKSRISIILSPVVEEEVTLRDKIKVRTGFKDLKRCHDQTEDTIDCLSTPTGKRRKTTAVENISPFHFLHGWTLGSLFNYVKDGKQKNVQRKAKHIAFDNKMLAKKKNEKCLSATRNQGLNRVPLSQISNSSILDLTSIDNAGTDSDSVEVTKVSFDLTTKEGCHIKRSVGPLARHRSSGYLEEVVRLDEKKRYKELLSRFTSVALPEYSDSISPPTSQQRQNTVHAILPNPLFRKHTNRRPISIDLTNDEEQTPRTSRRSFWNERLHQSMSSSSILEYSQIEDVSIVKESFTKATPNIHEHSRAGGNELLDSSWIKKWRDTLDPVQLERTRQIKVEERRKEIIKRKQKEEFEELQKKIEEKSKSNEFPELTKEMLAKVKSVFSSGNGREIFVQGFNAEITRSDLATLRDATWLNDEVVNFYFNLLKDRNEKVKEYPKVHVFNTFFYPKIVKAGHASVKRWTRKVDIFAMDLILIPVHLGMHWCLATVDLKNKQIAYYDSLKGNNTQCLEAIKTYLQNESLDKKKTKFDFTGWTDVMPKDIPEQLNGCDCGVFMCKYAEYKSRSAKFTFTQANMPYFRKRMVYEIVTKQLL